MENVAETPKEKPKVNPAKNSTELAHELVKVNDFISSKQGEEFVEYMFKLIKKSLPHTGAVTITNFGKFELKVQEARRRFIPKTREYRDMPASVKLVFKPSKDFKTYLVEQQENCLKNLAVKKQKTTA